MANYLTLINNAISDFDKVWTALNKKGTVVADFLTGKAYDETATPTSDYGAIIGRLSYVPGLTSEATIAHFTSADTKDITEVSSVTKASTGSTYTINSTLVTPGYYDAGVKLTGSVSYSTVNLAGNKEWVLSEKVYTLSANDYIIGGITAAQGTVTNDGSIGFDTDKAPATTVTATKDSATTVATVDTDTGFKVVVKADARTTATVKASVTNTVTEGYVKDTDAAEAWEDTQAIDSSGNDTITINIQKGSVKVQSVGSSEAVASITSKTAGVVIDAGDKEAGKSYIELESSIEGLSLEAEITEGYVSEGKVNANANDIKLGKGTKYIKVGSSNDQTLTLTDAELAVSAGSEYLDNTGKAVTITVPAATTRTADVDPGYVTNAGTITLAGTKTVNIKNGTGVAKSKISTYSLSKVDTSLKLSDTNTSGAYAFTVTPNVTVDTTGTSAGWIDSITTGAATGNVASKTYYIEAGSVSVGSLNFDAEVIERNDDNNDGLGTVAIGDIFYDTVPAKGDYIKINAGFTYSATEGYIKSISASAPSVDRYLKKAVIALEQLENGNERFIVTQAGYLPSGTLTDISAFAPTPATVSVRLTGIGLTNTAPSTDKANDYHTITIAKGTTDAGYISATEGTLTGTYYLQKGSVSTAASLSAVNDDEIVREAAADGTVTYRVRSEVTANAGLTVGEGYVTETEVSGTTTKTENVDYHVNRAVFGTTTHTTNASITAANGIRLVEGNETSAYTVTPKIDSCSTTFTLTSAGYISAADADILKFENAGTTHNGTMTPISIHKGTGIATHSETHTGITVTDDFDTAEGNYTITVGGTVASAITLDDGYYGTNEKSINANFNVAKTHTVNRGSASVTTSGTTTMNAAANGVVIYDKAYTEGEGAGRTYYEIGATTTINATKGTVTNGYMKTGDISVSGNTSTGAAYVEAFNEVTLRSESNPAPTGTAKHSVTIGQTSDAIVADSGKVLATAEKFNKKDIEITLSAHAMGSSVVEQLLALEARLSGTTANILS